MERGGEEKKNTPLKLKEIEVNLHCKANCKILVRPNCTKFYRSKKLQATRVGFPL